MSKPVSTSCRILTIWWSQRNMPGLRLILILFLLLATRGLWAVFVSDFQLTCLYYLHSVTLCSLLNVLVYHRWRRQHSGGLVLASWWRATALPIMWCPLQTGGPWAPSLTLVKILPHMSHSLDLYSLRTRWKFQALLADVKMLFSLFCYSTWFSNLIFFFTSSLLLVSRGNIVYEA